MSRVYVAVHPPIIRWALNRSGLSEEAIRVKLPGIGEWLMGERRPTLKQLETLARITRTPLGHFFLAEPPEETLPIPYFRTIDDQIPKRPSPELLDTVYQMHLRQEWMREYLIEEGCRPLAYVGTADIDAAPTHIAAIMRMAVGLEPGWAESLPTWEDAFRTMCEALEQSGVIVVANGVVGNNTHRKLDVNEFRGFVLADEYAPLIFVNAADSKAARMFTLAHELAHVVLGASAAFDLRAMQPAQHPIEDACNKAAAEFLVPEAEIRATWPSALETPDPYQAVARAFKVSLLVAARRALDVGLITKGQFFRFYESYMDRDRQKDKGNDGGGNFYATQDYRVGRRFAVAVARAAREGRVSYTEAFRLTGLYGSTFDKYVAHAEGGGLS